MELDNRIICFDIKELGKQLKKLGMLIVQDQVWNRVTINRNSKKNTRYYIDEFHLLLKEEQTAAYSVEIWKRFRKWGGVPTGITQNIKDLLASRESVVHTVLEDFYAVGTLADELTDGFHMEAHGYLDREEVNARLIAFARKLEQVLDKWETHAALLA